VILDLCTVQISLEDMYDLDLCRVGVSSKDMYDLGSVYGEDQLGGYV
jgi:hypothetical protein